MAIGGLQAQGIDFGPLKPCRTEPSLRNTRIPGLDLARRTTCLIQPDALVRIMFPTITSIYLKWLVGNATLAVESSIHSVLYDTKRISELPQQCELVSWKAIFQNHPKWHLLWISFSATLSMPGPLTKPTPKVLGATHPLSPRLTNCHLPHLQTAKLLVGSFGQPQPWMQYPEPPRPHRVQCLHLGKGSHPKKDASVSMKTVN